MKLPLMILLAGLVGCQQTSSTRVASETPTNIMVRVASQAQTCWFKNNDPAFAEYRLATELNSPAGRPRILIVPKNNPGGLPKLVVQAQRNEGVAGVATFGPLLDTKDGIRIQNAVSNWASGSKTC